MNNSIKTQITTLLQDIGEIKFRSMFGGFGVFHNGVMFALIIKESLHLRATNNNEEKLKALNLEPYRYSKRGFPIVTKYYGIPQTWWENTSQLSAHLIEALDAATKENAEKKSSTPSRIKDLPNLTLSTERLLKKAGIDSVEKLQNEGAISAFRALQTTHSRNISLALLWAIEGALSGQHWSVVPNQRRDELLRGLQQ